MSNEPRALIVRKSKECLDGYIEITYCGGCSNIYRIASLDICECGIDGSRKIDFDEDREIHPDCPLPLISQIKKENKIHPQVKQAIINWIENNPLGKNKPFAIKKDKNSYTLNELLREIELETDFAAKVTTELIELTVDLLMRNVESWRELPK
jgi:hypothetical protein